jgi:hypothetical protein
VFLFVLVRFNGSDQYDATNSNKAGKGRTTTASRHGVNDLAETKIEIEILIK